VENDETFYKERTARQARADAGICDNLMKNKRFEQMEQRTDERTPASSSSPPSC